MTQPKILASTCRGTEPANASPSRRGCAALLLAVSLGGVPDRDAHAQATVLNAQGNPNSQFGAAIARVRDYDGDGQDDLLVGAPATNNSTGAVSIVSSATGASLLSATGAAVLARFGAAVLVIADQNGDQIGEIAVGAPNFGTASPAGAIRILNGSNLSQISTVLGSTPQANLGEHLVQLDDQTGDGIPEYAASATGMDVGAVSDAGAVLVFDGMTNALLLTIPGAAPFDAFGQGLGTVQDQSGDGRRELVIGAPGFDPPGVPGAGLVQVVDPLSGFVVRSFPGAAINASLGTQCDGVRDVNGDGVSDIIAGAPSESPAGVPFGGSCRVFSGATGVTLVTVSGQNPSDRLGVTVAGVGDLDRDGFGDYACGSPFISVFGIANAGQVTVFSGKTHALLYRFSGIDASSARGGLVVLLGDLDGNGRDEFVIGSPLFDGPAIDAGQLELKSALTGSITIDSTGKFGTPWQVTVQATPSSLAFMMIDFTPGLIPSAFGDICLALGSGLFLTKIPTLSPLGLSTFGGLLPGPGLVPPNTTFHVQCMVADPNSFSGFRTSECDSLTLIP